jgi:dTDP-3-amino-3,4,6-trideoxy-alpha-D-glucose transaminase
MAAPIPFVDLRRQYAAIGPELDRAVLDVLASTEFILGPAVAAFEEEWARHCEVAHCVGVASGTAALELAYAALDLRPGDEAIVPANTFIATVLPLLRLGVKPVLVDCDEHGLLAAHLVDRAVTPRTRAVVAVHLFGHPCDTDALAAVCDAHGLALVEDAAQAHGATCRGRRTGGLARIAAFSFYPGKNLGAAGDAGAVTTGDEALADRVRLLRDLGQRRKYEHEVAGTNERLDTLQAAVLRVKLPFLASWNARRAELARAYQERLADAVDVPRSPPWGDSVWHLFPIRTPRREALRARFAAEAVGHGLHYPLPLHLQPPLVGLGHGPGDFPRAESWSRDGLSLPLFPELEEHELDRVVGLVRDVVASAA